ncbi:MAG: WYL domain-containing protein [Leptolyngbya sp. Prado105]|jgi:hypothetical protein|nr:WYL domain-containing protein [Leptolyngbya sp. Prado105]
MRFLQTVFGLSWTLGYIGNGLLFAYVEWSFLRQNFLQIFNPLLHLQVLGVLLTTPLFWIFLAMAAVGYYMVMRLGRQLERRTKQSVKRIEAIPSVTTQPSQERNRLPTASIYETPVHAPPKTIEPDYNSQVGELEIRLLNWAIQSNQQVRFHYTKQNGEESDRTVTPICLTTANRTTYLEGVCDLRRARRNFAVHRMRDLHLISQGTEQRAICEEITSPTRLNSSKSLSNAVQEKTAEQRQFIQCRIDELEYITNSVWNNVEELKSLYHELSFRSSKRAVTLQKRISIRLAKLQESRFPSTTANSGLQTLSSEVFKYENGVLKQYGYKVGMNGLPDEDRWRILDQIFLSPLAQSDNNAYLSEWGDPNSARRLQKMSNSIAAFARNAKHHHGNDYRKAIQDWETDLVYLKNTYYKNWFSFRYPRTK